MATALHSTVLAFLTNTNRKASSFAAGRLRLGYSGTSLALQVSWFGDLELCKIVTVKVHSQGCDAAEIRQPGEVGTKSHP